MKKSVFLVLFALSACVTQDGKKNTTAVYVSSNVPADIYVNNNDYSSGQTPRLIKKHGSSLTLTFKAAEYIPASITIYQGEQSTKKSIMSTTSGDPPVERFLLANGDFDFFPVGCAADNPFMSTLIWTCIPIMITLPTFLASGTSSELIRPTVPYIVEEYEPAQFHVYMFKENRSDAEEKLWQISSFVLRNFSSNTMKKDEFIDALVKMTGLSDKQLRKILSQTASPDKAANAVVLAVSKK